MTHSTRLSVEDLPEEIKTSTNRETSFRFFSDHHSKKSSGYIRRTIEFADGNKARASEMWEFPVGLYMGNSSATTLDTNPTGDLMGPDTACREMVETA